jgi:hypothetical protein
MGIGEIRVDKWQDKDGDKNNPHFDGSYQFFGTQFIHRSLTVFTMI